jgi:hypothetical protein
MKQLFVGNYSPFIFRTVVFGNGDVEQTIMRRHVNIPLIVIDADGQRNWGMIRQSLNVTTAFQHIWSFRSGLAYEQ